MSDWEEYAPWSDHCYTRNLIDDGNGNYNLMLICWNHGQASSIHTHVSPPRPTPSLAAACHKRTRSPPPP